MKYIICLLLLLPIFFMPICHLHDWGDDFALYIQQAKSIGQNKSASQSLFIYNKHYPSYSPQSYPIGFPIILSFVDQLTDAGINAYQYAIIALLFLSGLLFFRILIQKLGDTTLSLIMTMALIYHPFFFAFREQVLADIPLLFFCLLFYLVYEESKLSRLINIFALAFIAYFAFAIKTVGLTLLIAYYICEVYRAFLDAKSRIHIYQNLLAFGGLFILFHWAFAQFSLDAGNSLSHFVQLTFSNNLSQTILDNLVIYKNEILAFWGNLGFLKKDFIAKLFSYSFAMVCLISWMIHRDRAWDFLRIFTFVFLLSIMIFPNYQQGLRYFIPILPCLFLLFLLGYKSFSERVKIPVPMSQIALPILFIYLYLAPNIAYTESIAKRSNENGLIYSPYSSANQKIMREIQNIIPQSDTLITSYPRAFALFTQRHTYTPYPDITLDNAIGEIAFFHQFYLLDYYPLRKKSIETLANAIHLNPSKYYIDTLATKKEYGLYKCTAR